MKKIQAIIFPRKNQNLFPEPVRFGDMLYMY